MSELEMVKLCLPVLPSGYTTDEANFLPCFIPDMSLTSFLYLDPCPHQLVLNLLPAFFDIAENLKPTLLSVNNVCLLSGGGIHPAVD